METMIIFDLETRDFRVEAGIYEIACLAVKDLSIIDELYLAEEIPNCTSDKKYGYGFYNISQSFSHKTIFKNFLDQYPYPLVAHNAAFDRRFLQCYGWVDNSCPFFCSMWAIKKAEPELERYTLDFLLAHFGVPNSKAHTAMGDVHSLFGLIKYIRPQKWKPLGDSKSNSYIWVKIKPRAIEDIDLPIPTTEKLKGHLICFTGKTDYPRHVMQEIAIKNGAQIRMNVSSKTTMLVVGKAAGKKKLEIAQEKGVYIISDREFIERMGLKGKFI